MVTTTGAVDEVAVHPGNSPTVIRVKESATSLPGSRKPDHPGGFACDGTRKISVTVVAPATTVDRITATTVTGTRPR